MKELSSVWAQKVGCDFAGSTVPIPNWVDHGPEPLRRAHNRVALIALAANFRAARQNEAPEAADVAAWVMSAVLISAHIGCGSQKVSLWLPREKWWRKSSSIVIPLRPSSRYPETGMEEINRDLPEADFGGVRGSHRNKGVSQAGI